MTYNADQEAIKIIYKDEFFAKPENKHRRDELIREILKNQVETENKIMNAKNQTTE
jgi:hypothetical protein|tara:strand:- start:718 stop:885 length:168 start_codon:yes stop_codon:yes gene_type:complete